MFIVDFLGRNAFALTLVIVVVVLFVLVRSLRIANEHERAVVFRLGKYNRTAGPGLYFVWFLIERQDRIDLRPVATAVELWEGTTRDNVPIKLDTVVSHRIVDPARAVMAGRTAADAIEQASRPAIRAVLGDHSLDEIAKSQDRISGLMRAAIDRAAEPLGLKVERVQIQNIGIPPSAEHHDSGNRGAA